MSGKKLSVPHYLRKPTAIISLGWVVLLVLASVSAPLWQPFDPLAQTAGDELQLPNAVHWLGTDELGRDQFSRLLASSSFSFYASLYTVVVAVVLGLTLALWAAEKRGRASDSMHRHSPSARRMRASARNGFWARSAARKPSTSRWRPSKRCSPSAAPRKRSGARWSSRR